MELISVVLVNWNGKKWLSKCLSSLCNQTYQPLEIILVDNGSEDGSAAFVADRFPHVRIVARKTNDGFAVGNTVGIQAARGSMILLLNTDTWVESSFVSEMYSYFTNHHCDVLGPREAGYGAEERLPACRMTIDMLGHPVKLSKDVNATHFYLQGVCLLFRKQLYEDTGGFDTNFFMYFEDVDWFWRLHTLGKHVCYFPDAIVHHAKATGSFEYSSQMFFWRNQYALKMLIKNYGLFSLLWALPAYVLQNVVEMAGLLFLGKPRLIPAYVRSWWEVLRSLAPLLNARRTISRQRIVPDRKIYPLMYRGFGKAHHFLHALKAR